MKMCHKCTVIFLLFMLVQMAWTDEEVVTLQNGLNDYTGCDDVHIANSDVGYLPGANDGSYTQLAIAAFEC